MVTDTYISFEGEISKMSSSDKKNGDLEKHFLEAMKDKTIALPIVAIRILCDVLAASNAGVSYENVIERRILISTI